MTMRTLILALLMLLPAAAAQGASFDCGKAETPVEHAICDNPELSRSDEVLAKAWATALGGLSDEARKVMQAGQRQWLDFAALSCTSDAQPFTAPLTEDQAGCLNGVYLARIRELEQSRMLSGWRFYLKQHFAVLDDPDPEWWGGVASKQFASPRIDDTVEAATAFNAMMDEAEAGLGSVFGASGELTDDDATSDVTTAVEVDSVTAHRISLVVNAYWMGHGAAHGNYTITYSHFLVDEERALEAADLFEGEGWEAALADRALAELDRTIEGGIWPESRDGVKADVVDPAKWRFTDQGLEIQFQPYEVTAYAYGAPTVTIPWEELRSYLVSDFERRFLY